MHKLNVSSLILVLGIICTGYSDFAWKKLWDGEYNESLGDKKFKGWVIRGPSSQWFLDDGAIHGTMDDGSFTMVWSDSVYTDATYQVTYKIKQGNSGIHFRARPDNTEPQDVNDGSDLRFGGTSARGLHIEVDHRDAGCIWCSNCGGWDAHSPGEAAYKSLPDPENEWIVARLKMEGRKISTWIRQITQNEFLPAVVEHDVGTHEDKQKGRFGFQMHYGTVRVWIKDPMLAMGCADTSSKYYDKAAVEDSGFVLLDNGSCLEANHGCKDTLASNYDGTALFADSNLCVTTIERQRQQNLFSITTEEGLQVSIKDIGNYQIDIYNVSGKLLEQKQGADAGMVNFQDLKQGIYYVKIHSEKLDITEKVLVF
ncbi:MAG: DUF1080 domain-containing protein [Fibrobacteria bacterium]|nr:DUF1080 domain-containing protein [Fibrobacteria bacterium]